jgi:DNA repair photolyase
VRWSNLASDAEQDRRLPGYRDPAVVRTFSAPEALDVRFYEVRARSALNRVPDSSLVPFRWTINPYRGCTHACVYCAAGDTPILMADGRTRPLADLRLGDAIVGTERRGRHRRYVTTEVLAHWATIKPAFRVTLEDGTELVTSGDHRFLTERGWRYVTGDGSRRHLTRHNALLGTGGFAAGPRSSPDYRRGYVCGMVRAGGHLHAHRGLRLALAGREALGRTEAFLAELGVTTGSLAFSAAAGRRGAIDAIGTLAGANVALLEELTRWPLDPSDDWRKGFLAGIFDAEGSAGDGALRVVSTGQAILDWTVASLRRFGFDAVEEATRHEDGLRCVRVRGGPRERLRFFHLTDPAITRKRTVQGLALESNANTRVRSVEPLGRAMPLYDITTGTGDFIANGVVSHNCFARPTHTYLDFDAGRDFEREIVVKVNLPEVLRVELARPRWGGEHVALGTNTDPYQWVESRYRLTQGVWEAMRDAPNPCSVLTKSPLLLRDLPLFRELVERTSFTACLSVPTLDERAWRATEPHTPNPRARLEAVAELNRSGVPCGILIAPLMPGINDAPDQVAEILALAAEAGATSVGGVALHLRGEVRGVFMEWLHSERPDLVPRYQALYRRGAYAPAEERRRLAALARGEGANWRARGLAEVARAGPRPASEGVREGAATGRFGGRLTGEAAPEAAAAPAPDRSAAPARRQEVLF